MVLASPVEKYILLVFSRGVISVFSTGSDDGVFNAAAEL